MSKVPFLDSTHQDEKNDGLTLCLSLRTAEISHRAQWARLSF